MDNIKNWNRIFKRINQSFKLQIVLCIILSIIVIGVYFIFDSIIHDKRTHDISPYIKLINQIEGINIESNKIHISGYAFLLDSDSEYSDISILLRSVDDKKEYWMDVNQTSRTDIDLYYNSEYNYRNSGFNAEISKKKLNTEKCYEIIISLNNYYSNERKTVSTNRYILNNELYLYNPYLFEQPNINIESNLLIEVFNKGSLCFYNKEAGMYVYQYNGQLFWIANELFEFNENKLTYIPYHPYTSHIDELPEERKKYGNFNLSFYFEEYEYVDENIAPYRMAIRDIPSDYPVTYVLTGAYDSVIDNFIWKEYFHLNHNFN